MSSVSQSSNQSLTEVYSKMIVSAFEFMLDGMAVMALVVIIGIIVLNVWHSI